MWRSPPASICWRSTTPTSPPQSSLPPTRIPTNVKSFLKETITTDADSGETAAVSDYVAQKTQENLELYAAVETRFDELGGQLTEAEEAQADSYASQLMDQYGDTYKANGIGLETLQRFERILLKSTDLLDLVYGTNGETPVSDADLTSHLENQMYKLAYYSIPLYNSSTYAFADDDQKDTMLRLAQAAVDSYNASAPADAVSQFTAFHEVSSAALSGIYAVLDSTVPTDGTASLQTELLSSSTSTRRSPPKALPTPSAACPSVRPPPCSIPPSP